MQLKHRKVLLLITVNLFIAFIGMAQTNGDSNSDIFTELRQPDSLGRGSITLIQSPSIPLIFDRMERINRKTGLMGFRIQIYNGSGQDAREAVKNMVADFISKFPEFDQATIYQEYQAPYFKLRVGDYRTKNEAYEFYHQLKHYFPNSYIVKSRINFPKLYVDTNPESATN